MWPGVTWRWPTRRWPARPTSPTAAKPSFSRNPSRCPAIWSRSWWGRSMSSVVGAPDVRRRRSGFIVPRGRGAETRYAREITPRILTELEKFFDMPYPYGKLDVAVVPRYWGTMEHPGIVALGQPLTLIKPAEEGL